MYLRRQGRKKEYEVRRKRYLLLFYVDVSIHFYELDEIV